MSFWQVGYTEVGIHMKRESDKKKEENALDEQKKSFCFKKYQ